LEDSGAAGYGMEAKTETRRARPFKWPWPYPAMMGGGVG
jgi:hypothetical protein